jgi:hypothetical protein
MTFVPTNDGRWVSENFLNLSEVIRDYDPQFELRWIPPERRVDPGDKRRAFCVFDLVTNSAAFFADEDATPTEILAHLFDIDNKRGDVLARMEARNAAIEALRLKADIESREAKKEYVTWLMSCQQNYIHLRDSHGEKIKVDDQFRRLS